MSYSYKSPGWVRAVQIGLGALTIVLSIYALTFPALTFFWIVILLSAILFFVGIEKIITGIFIPSKSRWATIGLGILVLIFAGIALSFPIAAVLVVIAFIGISLLFNGIARIVEGVTGKQHSGLSKAFLIGVGILAIIISILILAFPLLFGAVLAGIIIAIGLLITGIQMVTSGIAGRIPGVSAPQDKISR